MTPDQSYMIHKLIFGTVSLALFWLILQLELSVSRFWTFVSSTIFLLVLIVVIHFGSYFLRKLEKFGNE